MNLGMMKTKLVRSAGRGGLLIKKHSPEILIATGVIGLVTSTVMACRATLKVDEVLEKSNEELAKIHDLAEAFDEKGNIYNPDNEVIYDERDYKKDLSLAYFHKGVDLVKLYGPAVSLGVASMACILGAYNIMHKRNIALMAAYKTVESAFGDYRKRVVDKYGEEVDYQMKYGVEKAKVDSVEISEDGKEKKKKKSIDVVDPNGVSAYARFFDEGCKNWEKNPEYNLMFLKGQQNYMNDMLKARGHVFLNDVYDALGIPRTTAGQVVGWVVSEDGDNFIDFGLYDTNRTSNRDFVNGYEPVILLDFNVDGVIYDKI